MTWDPLIRLFHWSLAASVAVNYWWLSNGGTIHNAVGYLSLTLIFIRIAWGFVGPIPARFSNFIVGPRNTLRSVPTLSHFYRQHQGHSPLAGWMIISLLTLVILTGITGWMQSLDAFWGEDWVQLTHAYLSHLLIFLVAVHITAIIFIQRVYKTKLIQSMLW